MMRLSCRIEVERRWAGADGENLRRRWSIEKVHSIRITGDNTTLQDTCSIELPRNVKWAGSDRIPLRRGDQVKVWMGYDERLKLRFIGYIQEVGAKIPTRLTVLDSIYILRQRTAKKRSYANATLRQVLEDQMPKDMRWEVPHEVTIGQYRVTATTVAGVLEDLKKNYGVESVMVIEEGEAKLISYTVYPGLRKKAMTAEDGKNIISDNLVYRRKEDMEIRVEGISIQGDGRRITYSEGEGEVHTIYRYGLTMDQLRTAVKEELERLRWTGLSGHYETFGEPVAGRLDVVDVRRDGIEAGRYQVKGVDVEFGQAGYRQKVELGRQIAGNPEAAI